MSPFFSIIIPVYNVAPYLRECLDSVLAQAFTDWEAICVDDGSTDGSGVILDEYAAKDKRIKAIHQTNGGVSAARNAGLDTAVGEYVAFIDADDMVGPTWLNSLHEAVASHVGVDWIRTSFRWLKGDEITTRNPETSGYYVGNCVHNEIWRSLAFRGEPWSNVLRREIVGEVRFPLGIKWREDTCFTSQIVGAAHSFMRIDNDDYLYREVAGSASRQMIDFNTMKSVVQRLSDAWLKAPGERVSISKIVMQCLNSARSCGAGYKRNEWNQLGRVIADSKSRGAFTWSIIPFKLMCRWKIFLLTGWEGIFIVSKRLVLKRIASCLGIRKRTHIQEAN